VVCRGVWAECGVVQIKYYLEGSGPDAEAVGEVLGRVVEELAREWMEADKHGLGVP
jgi:hypothetical protein